MRVILTSGELSYTVGDGSSTGCNLTDGGFQGWYGTPSPKWSLTERQSGDGAHAISKEEVLYSARTVTMDVRFEGATPEEALELRDGLAAFAHRHVRVEVEDPHGMTWAEGVLSFDCDLQRISRRIPATVTIVCADPRRYGARGTAYLMPGVSGEGGLLYDETDGYLLLPIEFYGETEAQNSGTISNGGTSTAYPTITVQGDFPGGITITHSGGQLAYGAPIGSGGALVLDCLAHTASIRGVDVTRALTKRDFPSIEPGGSVTLSLFAEGSGTVEIASYDTYI